MNIAWDDQELSLRDGEVEQKIPLSHVVFQSLRYAPYGQWRK